MKKNYSMKKTIFSLIVISVIGFSCGTPKVKKETPKIQLNLAGQVSLDENKLLASAQNYFAQLPQAESFANNPKAKLGKKLYYETALSVNGKLSCNSCHMLNKYGVDNESTSPGHEGKRGDRNSPTVYNAWFHIAQFWDGRAKDLAAQAKGPILNPIEMGIPDEATAVNNIKAVSGYDDLFKKAYPKSSNPITYDNIADAIANFESTLATPAPIDNYLAGNKNALSDLQKQGLNNFINAGCITCHTGAGFGGDKYHKFGLINGPYWQYTGSKNQDEGRSVITGNEGEKYYFKVPSLRNIAQTSPYFHDGSVDNLEDAVKIMAKTQLDKDLSEQQVKSIVSFLNSLTGEIPAHAYENSNLATL